MSTPQDAAPAGATFVIDPDLKAWATPRRVEIIDAINKYGSTRKAAEFLGVHHSAVDFAISQLTAKARANGYFPKRVSGETDPVRHVAQAAGVRRWLFTAAQDDTPLHDQFWANLQAYAGHLGADLFVGPFTYNKAVFTDHETRNGLFAEDVQPFLCYGKLDLGPIVFCGEMNTLPTAVRPLSSMEPYTGQKWGVFPHAKVQLVSVPTYVGGAAKMIMTTGCCTLPNYIAKKAGLKAEFHHVIGATLVEIDGDGRVFCRQVNATDDGSFQDLDVQVVDGVVSRGHAVEAITWGDIHREKIDPAVAMAAWGFDVDSESVVTSDTMVDTLRPRYQFFHDLLDFEARNHHRIKDHHFRYRMLVEGTDKVEDNVSLAARFLRATERPGCESVVVFSNHDEALHKWLKTADYRHDVANMQFFMRCELAIVDAVNRRDREFNVYRWALGQADGDDLAGIGFVNDNRSFIICPDAGGGIECGFHGHLGINGARGSPVSFGKTAVKMNTGHTHSAGIFDGVYTGGLSGLLDQDYNRGLSSWSHSHICTYPNGKRTIITMIDGKWRA